MKHLTSGSSFTQSARFALRFSSAAGRYGISSPSTTPSPGGTLNAAASATTGPMRASCGSRSQLAVLFACQMPLRSGASSGVRGARYAWLLAARPSLRR